MATKPKIKIVDDSFIRDKIDTLYEKTNRVLLAKWSISMAKHIFDLVGFDYKTSEVIIEGFKVNEMWQIGKARMYDVRQSGFKVHKLARETKSTLHQTALRVAGQAIASGHMPEHSMVASDYAIKVINLQFANDLDLITRERKWQLEELMIIIDTNEQNSLTN